MILMINSNLHCYEPWFSGEPSFSYKATLRASQIWGIPCWRSIVVKSSRTSTQ